LQRLINHADATVRLARFGIALCALGYAVLVFPLIAEAASWAHGQWGTAAALLAGALAFVLAASLYFVFGELVPRGLGLGYPHAALQTGRLALRVVGPMRALVRPLSAFAASLLRGLGVDKGTGLESLDIEAQIELGSDNRPLSAIAQTIFRNALNMRELVVSDVLLRVTRCNGWTSTTRWRPTSPSRAPPATPAFRSATGTSTAVSPRPHQGHLPQGGRPAPPRPAPHQTRHHPCLAGRAGRGGPAKAPRKPQPHGPGGR
jgi:hypothetical protein